MDHAVRLTPDSATIKVGDPLLFRVDMSFGTKRPADYPAGWRGLGSSTVGLVLSICQSKTDAFSVIRTSDYDTYRPDSVRPLVPPSKPPGHADAAFIWIVADRDTPPISDGMEELAKIASVLSPRGSPKETSPFDKLGTYSVRARVFLRDTKGVTYPVYSPPVAISVEPQTPAVLKASADVRPILYRHMHQHGWLPGDTAARLQTALPNLGDSGTASATRRLLALNSLRHSEIGAPRTRSLAECDRLRDALSAIGREAFSLDLAIVLARLGEADAGLARLKDVPPGPQRLLASIELAEGQRGPRPPLP